MFRTIAMLLACAPMAAPAWAADPVVIKRTGKWVLNYDTDSCHLLAEFGTGEARMFVRFSRFTPGDGLDLSMYSEKLTSSRSAVDAKVDFGLGSGPADARVMYANAGKFSVMLFGSVRLDGWNRIAKDGESGEDVAPKVTPEQEARVTSLTYSAQFRSPVRLEFGSLANPLAQMRDCTANLVRTWGYDPDVQAALTRSVTPKGAPSKWLRDKDYPSEAVRNRQSGIVQFRLDVDSDGRVLGCHVLARTDPDAFADHTCKTLRARAVFDPALDAQGKPVRSFFVSKVTFKLG